MRSGRIESGNEETAMSDDIDRLIGLLRDAPMHGALDRIEGDVACRIALARTEADAVPSLRFAAAALALTVGIGFGVSSAVVPRGMPDELAHYVSGADLAPSSLLGVS